MINVSNLSLRYGKRILFEDVNIKFTEGNCYGIIGANGAGKSTFLKILSGEIEPTSGRVEITKGQRMSVLKQDHHKFDDIQVLQAVIMGNEVLYKIMQEKDAIYAKEDFTEEDGMRAGELEATFGEMDGWNAESDAATLLSSLGVKENKHTMYVKDLDGNDKVRVLLAQALFGNPDILLLDEPTNDLDLQTIGWLENFLADYDKVVLVVSHDRHFLDTVCTAVADIDFGKINVFSGNYSFWYESSQLLLKQRSDQNRKAEDKIAELKEFIARFSANASKSKQATSRKKALDKIKLEDMQPSNRKYPAILFNNQVREAGDQIIEVKGLGKTLNGEVMFKDISFDLKRGQKVTVISENSLATTAFYKILNGEDKDFDGEFRWGVTITPAYLPADNTEYFEGKDLNLVDWLRQYSEEKDETFIRGFLGRMLFSGEETQKKCTVLSGGEKVRCMLSRMMMQKGNLLMFDEPTNHLDLESITALNNGMKDFRGTTIFTSRDHELTQTVCDRILEITPGGLIDREMPFDEYINDEKVKQLRAEMYGVHA
ncbi:ABC-F family ATP-binding cassette domain-containing protein [Taibaiella chishuiensis]|uniref:Probable ATP-binding protein YbiT n=1 Tax=Taibaiella chishuiensis TaxID=1434707 RepID=A0A2P8D080_9BACT|nr:ATP-binding cassette domain-containing protein [Taibaiella chishuiensis]PSK90607.1 ATPase subunit of ABC transporter with duplicated ATPase domains [Taibaiella chishuiensis]